MQDGNMTEEERRMREEQQRQPHENSHELTNHTVNNQDLHSPHITSLDPFRRSLQAVAQPQHTQLHPPGLQSTSAAACQSSSISQIPSQTPSRTLPPVNLRPQPLHSTLSSPPGLGLPTRSVSTQSRARKQSVTLPTGSTGVCGGSPVIDSRPSSISHAHSLLRGQPDEPCMHRGMMRMQQQQQQAQQAAAASAGPFPSPQGPPTHTYASPVWNDSPVSAPLPSPAAPPLHSEVSQRGSEPPEPTQPLFSPEDRNANAHVSQTTPDVPPGFEFEPQHPPPSPLLSIGSSERRGQDSDLDSERPSWEFRLDRGGVESPEDTDEDSEEKEEVEKPIRKPIPKKEVSQFDNPHETFPPFESTLDDIINQTNPIKELKRMRHEDRRSD